MADIVKIHFNNANSRDTYFTVHNVKEAQKLSKGKGVKVGIIDWSFAMSEHKELYACGVDLTGVSEELFKYDGHGLMMATVLKEIAPQSEVYAINAINYEKGKSIEEQDEKRSGYLLKAIDWAIENRINILTYSQPKFSGKYRDAVDNYVDKAVKNGITTTFIHCDNPNNIYPYGCFKFANDEKFRREPDLNIFHFDYNTLFIEQYKRFETVRMKGETIRSGNDIPYFSFSSMSPVLAGFVALLKSINSDLTPEECKDVLIKTSYEVTDKSENCYDINPCRRVVDIGKAIQSLL